MTEGADTVPSELSTKERTQYEFQVHLEEYKSCRTEIIEQVKLRASAITVAATFILGLAALAGTLATKQIPGTSFQAAADHWVPWLLLLTPVFSFTLGMWIVHKDCMIFYLAAYINQRLKRRLDELIFAGAAHESGVLNWDGFRAREAYAGRITLWVRKVSACFPHITLVSASTVALVALKVLRHKGQAPLSHFQVDLVWADLLMTVVFAVSALWVGLSCEKFRIMPVAPKATDTNYPLFQPSVPAGATAEDVDCPGRPAGNMSGMASRQHEAPTNVCLPPSD